MKQFIIMLILINSVWSAEKYVYVDLDEQIAYAYEDGYLAFKGQISSGKASHRTPVGTYKVLEKKRYHKSNRWPEPGGGAIMNYMLRLNYDGIAMHLGVVGKYPLSHGCVRMKNGFAQKLWAWAEIGTRVEISGFPPQKDTQVTEDIMYDDTYTIDP